MSIRIEVREGRLVVELRGWDAVFCCRRRVDVPLGQVESVAIYPRSQVPAEGLRLPGTSVPGVIRAGSYGVRPYRDFWDVRSGAEVLVVQLKPGADYRRLVLELPNAGEEVLRLRPLVS